jgi:hypothetical protein
VFIATVTEKVVGVFVRFRAPSVNITVDEQDVWYLGPFQISFRKERKQSTLSFRTHLSLCVYLIPLQRALLTDWFSLSTVKFLAKFFEIPDDQQVIIFIHHIIEYLFLFLRYCHLFYLAYVGVTELIKTTFSIFLVPWPATNNGLFLRHP